MTVKIHNFDRNFRRNFGDFDEIFSLNFRHKIKKIASSLFKKWPVFLKKGGGGVKRNPPIQKENFPIHNRKKV